MATVLLIRHGRTYANEQGVLAGTAEGTLLDDTGMAQAKAVGQDLSGLAPSAIISSPLERTMQTATLIAESLQRPDSQSFSIVQEPRLLECNYGDWTGKSLSDLASEELWRAVQDHPSSVTFPGEFGESMASMQSRAVTAIRHWNDVLGPEALYIAVSHGDVIKSIIADALGSHLDHFQRIRIDPGSVSVIRYSSLRPFVLTTNSDAARIDRLITASREQGSDAPVGGGNS
jgi:probable phosphomutase (TIGR03848 family)